jgi:hypothetical protein
MSDQSGAGQPGSGVPPWQQVLNAETPEQRYLRQIRGAVYFMATVLAIGIIVGIVGVVIASSQLSKLNCQASSSSEFSSC